MAIANVQRLQLLQLHGELENNVAENDEVIAQLLYNERPQRRQRRRTFWVRPWISRQPQYGHFHRLMIELETKDELSFKNFLRVEPNRSDLSHDVQRPINDQRSLRYRA